MIKLLLSLLFTGAFGLLSAQTTLQYQISFPNAVHHEAEVSLLVSAVPSGPLKFRMSRSSPGRYATHEFGKNMYNIKAYNAKGASLGVIQMEGDVWQVSGHDGTVKITYTVFGNWVDGTYLGIDETHAHMNMPATFIWVIGMDKRPITIKFNDLDKYKWRVATQLKPSADAAVYTAPGLQYFMDSPTELSAYKVSAWTDVNTNGRKQEIMVSSHTIDDQQAIDGFAGMVKKVVNEAKSVYGELPAFDYGKYNFLHDVSTYNAGDGMEHRNSTVITQTTDRIAGNENRLLGTFSHEFFHAWNVERIRPKTLEPFNFAHANMSNELWFAEGFTQYYGPLIIKRAGLSTLDMYCSTLSGTIGSVLNSAGAAAYSAPQMSRHAVFTDAGVSVDQNNYTNIFLSYYTYGAFIAIALDLRLRNEFNLSLDHYMQAVWKTYGKTEIPYTIPNLQAVLGKVANPAFADDFFKRYIYGTEKNDYVKLLAPAGLILRKAMPGKATLGSLRLSAGDNGHYNLTSGTNKGNPAYQAGLDIGDVLLKIGTEEVKSADLRLITDKYKPGDEVELVYEHKGILKVVKVKLQENTALEIVPIEKTGGALSREAELFRNNWLDTKVK